MQYLFSKWKNELNKKLKDKYILLFLDFDGTLTSIAKTPKQAVLSKKMKDLLKKISKVPRLKLAFISGRTLKDIKNKIGLNNVIYSGNHGLEIESPKIKFNVAISLGYKETIGKIKSDLNKSLSNIKGTFVEDKGLSLSLHYRLVESKDIAKVKSIFRKTVNPYLIKNKVKIKIGKMVLEVRPPVEWDKGKVAVWLLTREGFFLKDKPILPIYIGDDVSDEDAFRTLKNKGLTIFVGKPKESLAKYYLKDTKQVYDFLGRILEIRKGFNLCQN